MGHVRKVVISLLLLSLFTTYVVSITMFTHMHYVNGVMVVHSHFYKGSHCHTESNTLIIAHFASFHSLEADVQHYVTPERPVLYALECPECIPVVVQEHLKVLSLRAPPKL